jgi:hypothetical protein
VGRDGHARRLGRGCGVHEVAGLFSEQSGLESLEEVVVAQCLERPRGADHRLLHGASVHNVGIRER